LDAAQLQQIHGFTYGDVVAQSHAHLLQLRSELRGQLSSEFVPPAFPTHVQIQTIGGCNASCVMCPMSDRGIRRSQRGVMPTELFAAIVREAALAPDCNVISPYLQNEPLLDQRLPELVRIIKTESQGRLSARIVTNGTLLDRKKIVELITAGIDVISISVNGFTKETYERVMPGLNLATTLRNIESLLELNPGTVLVILTYMVTRENRHEVDAFVDYWYSRGVLCGAWGIGTMTGNVPRFDAVRPADFSPRPRECFVPFETLTIRSDGTYLLCCSDWAHKSRMGRFPEQGLSAIWHSKELSRLRRDAILERFDHEICQKCLGQTKVPANLVSYGGQGGSSSRSKDASFRQDHGDEG
jgi:MoaA/NifB/PqqE/SkfB family radical SAM enzyme